jgi:hypothetical protein
VLCKATEGAGPFIKIEEKKKLTISFENCSGLLRVSLMALYTVMKAKRNTVQVGFLHF